MKLNPRQLLLLFVLLLTVGAMYVVQNNRQWPFKLGLDIQGGMHLILEAQDTPTVKVDNKVMTSVIQVIRNRVDKYGVAEPVIQREGSNRVVIDLPGVKDKVEARNYLGKTAQLVFMAPVMTSPVKDATGDSWVETELTGKMLVSAQAQPQGGAGSSWAVSLQFNPEGARLFGELTTKYNIGNGLPRHMQLIAIKLDDNIVSAPEVREPILGGNAEISGTFTAREAQLLASQLQAGALPVPLKEIYLKEVGASLGSDTVNSSIRAGIAGFVLVVLFMLAVYRVPGFVADMALSIYAILVLAIFKIIPVTLTVPGIAGFILSIGMAVDANVLIFERTKEELKRGRSLYSAIEIGFKRALTAIFDSNSTTLLTCAILYALGTGLVKGFALTLAIGVVVSLFTAISVTRALLHQVLEAKGMKNPTYFGVKL